MRRWVLLLCTAALAAAVLCMPQGGFVSWRREQAALQATTQPFSQETGVEKILDGMTLRQQIGQLFLIRTEQGGPVSFGPAPGGYLLFGAEFEAKSPEQVRRMTAALRDSAGIPPLVAVDEEGGTVARASAQPQLREERFPSPRELGSEGGLARVARDAREKTRFLTDLGIHVNLAPVADVPWDEEDFIYPRAFSTDAAQVAGYVRTYTSAVQACSPRVGIVLKHFPGYGPNGDTHTGEALDKRPCEMLWNADLLPFRAGIAAGADCVLMSHNTVACLDPEIPASLSEEAHRLLREELGFDGVIMTDDMAMEAVSGVSDPGELSVQALQAGGDLVCTPYWEESLKAVETALREGRLPPERIRESAGRVLCWKQSLGLL